MKILRRVLLAVLLLLILAAAGFVVWGSTPLGPMPEALAAIQSDAHVSVKTAPWLEFSPAGRQPQAGFIFYPGGRVDYRSYAPLARAIAAQDYLVVIPPMPLSLAVFSPAKAGEIIAAHPEIQSWAVGGHSLGGAMAANFVKNNPGLAAGLILLASYPAGSDNLTASGLKVLSIYGSADGLADSGNFEASHALLPADTRWVLIQGGNHAQFGWYGPQPGDGTAAIDRAAQQAQTVSAAAALLASIAP
jgi:pimeloyl-ACP methyl ester carboxylesterase